MKFKTKNTLQPREAGARAGEGRNADEVDMLVETLALASVEGSTQKVYWSIWQTWCRLRTIEGNKYLVGRNGLGRRSSKTVDNLHGPTMICVQTLTSNDPRMFP